MHVRGHRRAGAPRLVEGNVQVDINILLSLLLVGIMTQLLSLSCASVPRQTCRGLTDPVIQRIFLAT